MGKSYIGEMPNFELGKIVSLPLNLLRFLFFRKENQEPGEAAEKEGC